MLTTPDGSPLDYPISEYLLVPSRGLKDRGVTKSHPGLVIAGKPLQE
jgi:hypothetical protein